MTTIATRSDERLQHEVLRELNQDGRLKPAEVGVEVNDGVVTLTGVVSSASKIEVATAAALRAPGVTDIANEVTIAESGHERTDTQLAHGVRRALGWNPLLNADEIDCVVRHGTVTLRGTVDRWDQRGWAETTAASVPGVVSVSNQIEAVEAPSDLVLQHEIESCIIRSLPHGSDVEVSVRAGIATLRGGIGSAALRTAAEALASRTRGVRRVINQLVPIP